ncbi:MAG: xanthine dehydrogenase family protein molybdopterin-binding subunit [Nitrospinota bacterium]|nr:xanthine dehydrogenase family protein molybdopterin-binding subunit [Nitrospinota bacterium]
MDVLGKSYVRQDGKEMVLGESEFVDDLEPKNVLYGAVVRSGRPHARILKINTKKALSYPGVACVLTSEDVPNNAYGPSIPDQVTLCSDKVRYEGDPVVALCAESWEVAEEAAKLVKIDYEDLPPVFSPEEALDDSSFPIHESHPTGNLVTEGKVIKGDVESGFEEADFIIEARYKTQAQEHASIETHICMAEVDTKGHLTVHVSSQTPFRIRADLAIILGLPISEIRVLSSTAGGAFGGKHEIMLESLAAICALKTRCPVKFRMSREEEFTASTVRHPMTMDYKTGVTKDGKITAVQIKLLLDGGAYASVGGGVAAKGALMGAGPYKIDNVRAHFSVTYTNNGFSGAVRGFGATQTTYACERHMDLIAKKLKIDPLELRRRNAMETGDRAHSGDPVTSCGLEETMDKATRAIKWDSIGKGQRSVCGTKLRGRGMAAMIYPVAGFGKATPSAAFARVNEDATLTVITGIVDVGQGADIILRQVAAEELGIPLGHVSLINGDTSVSPYDPGSTGSRIAHLGGKAVKIAVGKVKEQLLEKAAGMIEASPEDLQIRKGEVFVEGTPEKKLSLKEVAMACHKSSELVVSEGTHVSKDIGVDKETHQGKGFECYVFATQCAEVEVDAETGEYRVVHLAAAHDVGTAINPMNVEGQIEGGASMGYGLGLMEDIQMKKGKVQNPYFGDYHLPAPLDMPEKFTSIIVQTIEPRGPYGVKGVAEPSVNPTAPAVVNAICDAIGAEITDLPATPEAVLMAMASKK